MELIVFIHVRQTAIMKCAIMSMDHVLVNLGGKGPTVVKVNSNLLFLFPLIIHASNQAIGHLYIKRVWDTIIMCLLLFGIDNKK